MDISQKLEVEAQKVIEAGQMMLKGDLVSMAKAKSILEYVVNELNKENTMMTIEKMKDVIKKEGIKRDLKNLPVGETFEVDGELYLVKKGRNCVDCCFSYAMCKSIDKPYCVQAFREDLIEVVFEKVEL